MGHRLKAKHIIHTVGPIWKGGSSNEQELLESCYKTSLHIVSNNRIKTVAYPCISTGLYGFPKDQAAKIAVNETKRFLAKNKYPEKVIFVTFCDENSEIYRNLLAQ
jgi:O-acetyl-ADP-ribose deacetylase (regulator of RNase III)